MRVKAGFVFEDVVVSVEDGVWVSFVECSA